MKKQIITFAVAALVGLGFTGCENASEKYVQEQIEKGVSLDKQLVKIASNRKDVWEVSKDINNKDMLQAIIDKKMVDFGEEKLSKSILETILYKDNYSMIEPFIKAGIKTDFNLQGLTFLEHTLIYRDTQDFIALINAGFKLKPLNETKKHLTLKESLNKFAGQYSITHTALFKARPTMYKNTVQIKKIKHEKRVALFTALQEQGLTDFSKIFETSTDKISTFNTNQLVLVFMNHVDKTKYTPEFKKFYYDFLAKQTIDSSKFISTLKVDKNFAKIMSQFLANKSDSSIEPHALALLQAIDKVDSSFIKNVLSSSK